MLGAGGNRIVGGQAATPLEPAHPGVGHDLAQQQILARSLDPAAPALVAGDVDHRRKGPVDACRRCLDRSRARGAFGEIGVETARLGQRHREDGAEAMDDVGGEDERDLEARLADRDGLHLPRHPRAIDVEHAAQSTATNIGKLLFEAGFCTG